MMVTSAFTAGFDRLDPIRIASAAVALWYCCDAYADLRRTWSWGAVGAGLAVFALWRALEPPGPGPGPGVLASGLGRLAPGWSAAWLAARVVGSVVVVPLAEELAFRGFLTRRLIRADFTAVPPGTFSWPSFLISSALFGVLHGRWLAGMLAGVAYALALYRRRELADAILAHATTNAAIAACVLIGGNWSLWA